MARTVNELFIAVMRATGDELELTYEEGDILRLNAGIQYWSIDMPGSVKFMGLRLVEVASA